MDHLLKIAMSKYCCILVASLPLLMNTCEQGTLSCIHGMNVPTQCPVFTALSVGGVYLQSALSWPVIGLLHQPTV